jgi:hypothetical protein
MCVYIYTCGFCILLTDFVEQSLLWTHNQMFIIMLKETASGSVLSLLNLAHVLKLYFYNVCFNIVHPSELRLPEWSVP